MKISIRMKITFMVVAFTAFVVTASWFICNYLISDIFTSNLKSNLKTTLKTFEAALEKEDKAGLAEIFQNTVKTIDMACTKGVLKTNTASRKKSAVAKKYNAAING